MGLCAVCGALCMISAPVPPKGVVVERVFAPEVKTGPYKHPASIAELRSGDLYLVYYGGEGEYALDTGVFGSRLKKGGRRWSKPERIAHDPFRSLGNAVIWQAPDGLVWLFLCRAMGRHVVHIPHSGQSVLRRRPHMVR